MSDHRTKKFATLAYIIRISNNTRSPLVLITSVLCVVPFQLCAQIPETQGTPVPAVPAWAQPGSATHTQVAPPSDFHRPSTNFNIPVGVFQGQSDIGSAVVPGSASYDEATKQYTIHSAGYNIWYTRDEFRYLWNKVSGDVSLAADIFYPDPNGYGDRKAVLVIRQSLDDDSKEAIVALHGAGMIHLAQRAEKDTRVTDMEYRIGGRGRPGGSSPDSLVPVIARRIGIEKRGYDSLFSSASKGSPCTSSGHPSICTWRGRFMQASVSALICRIRPIRLCCRMWSSRTLPGRFISVALVSFQGSAVEGD